MLNYKQLRTWYHFISQTKTTKNNLPGQLKTRSNP